ncbi:MAG: tetratricopeptide repeat protein [Flavobacteriales bacterium]|nr:tetratricopeptide repeat protein [Flavobacteriales bacterium]
MRRSYRPFCLVPLVLVGLNGACQGLDARRADSLLAVWRHSGRPDTARLEALYALAHRGYLFTAPDSAALLAEQGIAFARASGLLKHMAHGMNLVAVSHGIRGDPATALGKFMQTAEWFEASQEKRLHALALGNVGRAHNDLGQKTQAMEALMRSLRIVEELGDSALVASTLSSIGNIYSDIGDERRALDHYEQALAIATAIEDAENMPTYLISMASSLFILGDTLRASVIYERSIILCDSLGNGPLLATAISSLAELQESRSELAAAEASYQRSFALAEELGMDDIMATSLMGLGSIARAKDDMPRALACFERALALAQGTGNVRNIQIASELLYKVSKAQGRAEDALRMHEIHLAMKDSTTSEENRRGVMGQRFQYEYEKKEALLQAEQEKKDALAAEELRRRNVQRNAFIGGFGLMVLLAVTFLFQRNRISKARKRSDELLLNILPGKVAEELKAKGEAEAVLLDQVTVLFTDFKGFTAMSEKVTPTQLVQDLNECFSEFDRITEKHGIEKIKTIGDAYMAAGGLPTPNTTHATDVIKAALEMRDFIAEGKARRIAVGLPYFEIRIGIHTGPVVAGIVGVKKFQYDIWGDTVNTASRMESSGEVGQVNISEATYRLVNGEERIVNGNAPATTYSPFTNSHTPTPVHHSPAFVFTPRGKVQAKGKGEMEMYFVAYA